MKLIPVQRERFEIPDDVTYLNCASLSPQLRVVSAAGQASVNLKVEPWKIKTPEWFSVPETLRGLVAQILGADTEAIALIPSASYGIAVAAANVPVARGQAIVLLHEEFPSNYYAWKKLAEDRGAALRLVPKDGFSGWTEAVLDAIRPDTAVVSIPNCHCTDGSRVDLEAVGVKVRAVGAAFVVDASQSLGAYPLNVAVVQPDFLVSVGYKWLLGSYSLGYLYVAPHWRRYGQPIEHSWMSRADAEDFARLVDYPEAYRPGARRFDVGEFSNFVLAPMAIAALREILDWGIDNIHRSLSLLTARIASETAELGCLPTTDILGHMIGLRLPNGIPQRFGECLAEQGIYVGLRGDVIRVAPHLHTDERDLDRFFTALRKQLR